jgi:TolB protein
MIPHRNIVVCLTAAACLLAAGSASAQWTNRYAKLSDFRHHIYLEQHELPFLAYGPADPAPAPDGRRLALSARGWIWLLDLQTGTARRITSGAEVDSRPRWSADGKRIAFVRDTGKDTGIVILELATGEETLINTPAIELDPEFSADGAYLYYSSSQGDGLSLWRRHIASGVKDRLTDLPQVERHVRRLPDGTGIVYLHSDEPLRTLRLRDFVGGEDRPVRENTLTYHLTGDVHPRERVLVFSSPIDDDYHLYTMDLDQPGIASRLTRGPNYALTPSFSADGHSIFYVEPDEYQQFRLKRIPAYGGTPDEVTIKHWDYGTDLGTLVIETRGGDGKPVPARLAIMAENGHPVASQDGPTYFDSQTGRHYFYSKGRAEVTVPVGEYSILATHGPMATMARDVLRVSAAEPATASLSIETVWDAEAAGYVSVDYHVHLNGDGQHRATHTDALKLLAGEDLDQLSPMSWNRWERRLDEPLIGKSSSQGGRTVYQGQEIRSHFHGHVGLIGTREAYAPWFFGPSNPRLGDTDQTNGHVLAFADQTGAFATYVHPVGKDADPFDDLAANPIPLELVSDGVLADRMGLELVCAWTSPLGTAALWYRFLNIGKPIAAMSGTDGWVDFHRTPAMGTARAYVRPSGDNRDFEAVLADAIRGRSFLTTGPVLLLELGDSSRPGGTTPGGTQRWRIMLASTSAVDRLEIVVNGAVVQTEAGVSAGRTRTYTGQVDLPAGGWVAARAYASEPPADAWPTMAVRPFVHTSPIWIGEIGSVDPSAQSAAAIDLLRALDAAESRAREAYGEVETPAMQARFEAARARLTAMSAKRAPSD